MQTRVVHFRRSGRLRRPGHHPRPVRLPHL